MFLEFFWLRERGRFGYYKRDNNLDNKKDNTEKKLVKSIYE
jgi:hypothetical protein